MIERYAVVGNPIAHSLSPAIHYAFAQQEGIRLAYHKILAHPDAFFDTVTAFQKSGARGLSVTAPFKVQALSCCMQKSFRAQAADAVNTLYFKNDGTIYGDNTDGIGLVRDLKKRVTHDLSSEAILMLGAGGAARGIIGPLIDANIHSLHIANRTPEKAKALLAEYAFSEKITYSDLNTIPENNFTLVINASSSSLNHQAPNIADDIYRSSRAFYDLSYARTLSPFLLKAKQFAKKQLFNGIGMLIEQAACAFDIWHNIYPETRAVLAQYQRGELKCR